MGSDRAIRHIDWPEIGAFLGNLIGSRTYYASLRILALGRRGRLAVPDRNSISSCMTCENMR